MMSSRLSSRLASAIGGAILCVFHGVLVKAASAQPVNNVNAFFRSAIDQRDALAAAEFGTWEFVGPFRFSTGLIKDFGAGYVSGRVNGIAVSRSDPKTLYIATPSGGVWKSTDRGRHWSAVSPRVSWKFLQTTAIAVDPSNPRIVYAGTGDYHRFDHVPPFGFGVLRSTDGGSTWLNSGDAQFGSQPVSRIVIDPENSQLLTLTTGRGGHYRNGGIWHSIDAGASWSEADPAAVPHAAPIPIPAADWDDLEICPDGTYWATASQTRPRASAAVDAGGLLFRSKDHGATWLPVTIPPLTVPGIAPARVIDFATSIAKTVHLACSPNRPGRVFVATIGNTPARFGIFQTTDGGLHWSAMRPPADAVLSGNNNLRFPWGHSHLSAGALGGEDVLYLGLVDLFRLRTDGGSWEVITMKDGGLHTDQQAGVMNTDPAARDSMYFANDGGVYLWNERKQTVRSLNRRLGITQVYRVNVHSTDFRRLAAGSQDNGSAISLGPHGPGTGWAMVSGGDGRAGPFDSNEPKFGYLVNTVGRLVRYDWSVAGPSTWGRAVFASPPGRGENPLAFSDHLFAGSPASGLLEYANPDPGAAPTASALPVADPAFTALEVCTDSVDSVVYVGLDGGRIFRKRLSAGGWTDITDAAMPAVPVRSVHALDFRCRDVLVGFGYDSEQIPHDAISHGPFLFHTSDARAAHVDWQTPATGGPSQLPLVPVRAAVRNPFDPLKRWIVGTEVGLFASDDAGATWKDAGGPNGLPNTFVRDMRVTQDGTFLYASAFGRGIWRARMPIPTRVEDPCLNACKDDRNECMRDAADGGPRPQACVAEFRNCKRRCEASRH